MVHKLEPSLSFPEAHLLCNSTEPGPWGVFCRRAGRSRRRSSYVALWSRSLCTALSCYYLRPNEKGWAAGLSTCYSFCLRVWYTWGSVLQVTNFSCRTSHHQNWRLWDERLTQVPLHSCGFSSILHTSSWPCFPCFLFPCCSPQSPIWTSGLSTTHILI